MRKKAIATFIKIQRQLMTTAMAGPFGVVMLFECDLSTRLLTYLHYQN